MQPDPARIAEAREWLVKAALDLRAATHEFSAQPPLTGDIMFHCQQLAEKSLTAFLAWHDDPFRRTHHLVEIGEQCVAIDPTLDSVVRRAAGLSDYPWRYRYPGDPDEPPTSEAEAALALAKEVHEAILSRLPEDVKP